MLILEYIVNACYFHPKYTSPFSYVLEPVPKRNQTIDVLSVAHIVVNVFGFICN